VVIFCQVNNPIIIELDRFRSGDYNKEDGGHVMQTIAQQLREEGIKIGEEKGKEDKAKETAKRMLEDGLPIEAISKYTGLTREEIERLREILQ
jgi:predicted transposase/invertase (TIGR01784 family)